MSLAHVEVHPPWYEAYVRGAKLFDGGAFFEAHEAWEERWRVETDAGVRRFLQGLIQIAAAFHKAARPASSESASRLLARGLAKLETCPDEVSARIGPFRDGLRACARALLVGTFDPSTIPRLA